MSEYSDVMDAPEDEDGFIAEIIKKFTERKDYYPGLLELYKDYKYPSHGLVQNAIARMDDMLSQQRDNTALIDRVLAKSNALLDSKNDTTNMQDFIKNQTKVFD